MERSNSAAVPADEERSAPEAGDNNNQQQQQPPTNGSSESAAAASAPNVGGGGGVVDDFFVPEDDDDDEDEYVADEEDHLLGTNDINDTRGGEEGNDEGQEEEEDVDAFFQEDASGDVGLAESSVGGEGLALTRQVFAASSIAKRKRSVTGGGGGGGDNDDDDDVDGRRSAVDADGNNASGGSKSTSRLTLGDVHPSVLMKQLYEHGGSSGGGGRGGGDDDGAAPEQSSSSSSTSSEDDEEDNVVVLEDFSPQQQHQQQEENNAVSSVAANREEVAQRASAEGEREESSANTTTAGQQPLQLPFGIRPLGPVAPGVAAKANNASAGGGVAVPPRPGSVGATLSSDLAADAALAAESGDHKRGGGDHHKREKKSRKEKKLISSLIPASEGHLSSSGRFTRASSTASEAVALPAYDERVVVATSDQNGPMVGQQQASSPLSSEATAGSPTSAALFIPHPWMVLREKADELAGKQKRKIAWVDAAAPEQPEEAETGGGSNSASEKNQQPPSTAQQQLAEHRYVGPNAQMIRMRREEAFRREELKRMKTMQDLQRRKEMANQVLDSSTGTVYRVVSADEFDRKLLVLGDDVATTLITADEEGSSTGNGSNSREDSDARRRNAFPRWEQVPGLHDSSMDDENGESSSSGGGGGGTSFFDLLSQRLRELSVDNGSNGAAGDGSSTSPVVGDNASFTTPNKLEQKSSNVLAAKNNNGLGGGRSPSSNLPVPIREVTFPKTGAAAAAGIVELNSAWLIGPPPLGGDDGDGESLGGGMHAAVPKPIRVPM